MLRSNAELLPSFNFIGCKARCGISSKLPAYLRSKAMKGGSRVMLIKPLYDGHAKQPGTVAARGGMN
jgi:hypothetical protein